MTQFATASQSNLFHHILKSMDFKTKIIGTTLIHIEPLGMTHLIMSTMRKFIFEDPTTKTKFFNIPSVIGTLPSTLFGKQLKQRIPLDLLKTILDDGARYTIKI